LQNGLINGRKQGEKAIQQRISSKKTTHSYAISISISKIKIKNTPVDNPKLFIRQVK